MGLLRRQSTLFVCLLDDRRRRSSSSALDTSQFFVSDDFLRSVRISSRRSFASRFLFDVAATLFVANRIEIRLSERPLSTVDAQLV